MNRKKERDFRERGAGQAGSAAAAIEPRVGRSIDFQGLGSGAARIELKFD
jgi:hypothetical protein